MDDRRAVIQARALRVAFGDVVALDGLDLIALASAVTAVLGPNGAGKTTLVRAVPSLQPYDAASLMVGASRSAAPPSGCDAASDWPGSRQQAAIVQLTGRENLHLVARLYGQGRRDAAASASRVIDSLRLGALADRRVTFYSGRQRASSASRRCCYSTSPPQDSIRAAARHCGS